MMITNTYVGWPGSTHDARVLRNSKLYDEADACHMFQPGCYIIGDGAYPLRNWLITPFRETGNLTPQQQRYNYVVSSLRQVVERSIGHLKGCFRKLREVYMFNIEGICKDIFAACVLHNLRVLENDDLDDYMYEENQDPNNYPGLYQNNEHGVHRRNQLVQMM